MAVYEEIGRVKQAATAAGVDCRQHYRWLKNDPEYAAAFDETRQIAAGAIMDEIRRRAMEGVRRPVLYKAEPVKDPDNPDQILYVFKYSDRLLMFLLKHEFPDKYGDHQQVRTTNEADEEWELIAGKTMDERKALVRVRLQAALDSLG